MGDIVGRLMEARERPFREKDRASMTFAAGEIVRLRSEMDEWIEKTNKALSAKEAAEAEVEKLTNQLVTVQSFERWLIELAANALSSAAETRKIAADSWGSGFDTGYSDALEHVLARLPSSTLSDEKV